MYKIVYVDEYQDDIDNFLDYFDEKDSEGNLEIIPLFPKNNINETIEEIFTKKPDAVVSDYMLNEYKIDIQYNVPYTGVDLIERILERREKFPSFVMTSYDDQAIKTSQDVNLVYIKDILHGSEEKTNAKANFVDTVQNQIIHYKKRIEDAEKELDALIQKSETESLTANEEERIFILEKLIEEATDKKCKIPRQLKELKTLEGILNLIKNTDSLIEELKK